MTEAKVNRKYKDTIFRMLFKEKENLLSLYNAVNGTSYVDTDGLGDHDFAGCGIYELQKRCFICI